MDPVREYNALLEADPGAALAQAEALKQAFLREGITFAEQAMPSFLRPHLVPRAQWDTLRDTGRRIMTIAERCARQVFGGDVDKLCAYLGTPPEEVEWVRLDPGMPDVVLSRLDAFVENGEPRFIEINSDAPAGFGYGDRMARVFQDLPVFRDYARLYRVEYQASGPQLVRAVLSTWHQYRPSAVGAPLVSIVDLAEVKTRADQAILKQAFEAAGVRCVLSDPREMGIVDDRLVCPEGPIDIVYRRGLLQELLEEEDDVRSFMEAYRRNLAVFVNSFRCRLSEDKAFFGLLTDENFASLLSAEEHALMARYVPWTRKVEERKTVKDGRTIDLVPWLIEQQTRLVLKPAHGYGGASVLVGDEVSSADWDGGVRAALSGQAWVVQDRVTIPEEIFPVVRDGALTFEPRKVNVNPFYVAGAEVGAVTRASQSSVINVSAGGGSVPTFVVG